ncbi:DUF4405 domain-containing protein [Salmonella enterica subsp. enterica serovar Mississippi]|nr:DUF4405 domain-containing protein [Salmonella enterica subsp. enterica serovar Mississippi]
MKHLRTAFFNKTTLSGCMIALIVAGYGYQVTGPILHELAGFSLIALFTIHSWTHRRWFTTLLKGRYNPLRQINTVFALSAGLALMLVTVSGILNSDVLNTQTPPLGRAWHVIPAYWLLITMALHLGIHWRTFYNGLKKLLPVFPSVSGGRYLLVTVCIYGLYGIHERYIFKKLIGWFSYDLWPDEKPAFLLFLQYISIVAVFSAIGYYSFKTLQKKRCMHR